MVVPVDKRFYFISTEIEAQYGKETLTDGTLLIGGQVKVCRMTHYN